MKLPKKKYRVLYLRFLKELSRVTTPDGFVDLAMKYRDVPKYRVRKKVLDKIRVAIERFRDEIFRKRNEAIKKLQSL